MTMYWIYDIPTWALAVLTITVFVAISLAGLFATRPHVKKLLGGSSEYNDLVSYFVAAVGVFYGLALGLIAVATWEDFTETDSLVSREAAALAALYSDLDGYPSELRERLEAKLRDYARIVIKQDWPAHRKGQTPEGGSALLEEFENEVMAIEPTKEREKIGHAAVVKSLDSLVEARRLRLLAVNTALPGSLWSVVLFGAVLNIGLTYLFYADNVKLHAVLISLLATFIALLVFVTAAMDNPFRGEFSVSPDAFQEVLERVMTPKRTV